MENIIGRCGYRCDLCLAYKRNSKSQNDRQRFKDGLFRVYKYTMALKKCYCEGCLANDDENPVLLDAKCKVRSCVIKKGLENCAYCEEYPCEKLAKKFIEYKKVAEKSKKPISEEDHNCFIKPYESRKVLDKIRQEKGLE